MSKFNNLITETGVRTAKITLKKGLAPEYYAYAAAKPPITLLDFSKIAEVLYDTPFGLSNYMEDIDITLNNEVPIGEEALADRIPIWLVINVTTIGAQYKGKRFDELIVEIATRVIEILIEGRDYYVTVDVDSKRYIVSAADKNPPLDS